MTRISFLAPRFPPRVCGVGDHTWWMAETLRGMGATVGFIHGDDQHEFVLPPGPVDFWDGTPQSLIRCVNRQQPDWLWVQLSGYGYSRWGAPYRLGVALKHLKRNRADIRLVIYLHETHCRRNQLGIKGPVLSPWQRFTVGRVARMGDLVFCTIPRYREQAIADYGVCPQRVSVVPVGTNIPVKALDTLESPSGTSTPGLENQ